jgi:hypothetical protein
LGQVLFILSSNVQAQDPCQKFHDKYQVCLEKRDAGYNVDYDACRTYGNKDDCEAHDCFWNTTGLPAPGACVVNVCYADVNSDGDVDGKDLAVYKKDLFRVNCPKTPSNPGYLGAPVPKTGQTTCYDSSGTPRDCAGTGEDGEYQMGVAKTPRFTDHGNGTVTDNLTGLMWTKDAQQIPGQMTWQAALDACNNLVYPISGGYDDWRLPNLRELQSLIDYENKAPALPSGHPFTNSGWFSWSSTTTASSPDRAWVVTVHDTAFDSDDGNVSSTDKHGVGINLLVWAVRAGQ